MHRLMVQALSIMVVAHHSMAQALSSDTFASAFLDLAEDVILVNRDKNKVAMGPETPALPDLPLKRAVKLECVLENNVSHIFCESFLKIITCIMHIY